MTAYGDFPEAIRAAGNQFHRAVAVHPAQWQSTDVSDKPDMAMREVLNYSFQINVNHALRCGSLDDIGANLPWAEDHFQERVSEEPLNPGNEWQNWAYAHSADRHRNENGQFSHTYMERYWPKMANTFEHHLGIRYQYGDLLDVVDLLEKQPLTRQAYLPVWFPEDTGVRHGGRVPCSLGYHFIMRNGFLHCTYYIRSCDFIRHFQDDVYLTIRLMIWMLSKLKTGPWADVQLGLFSMHIVSLHMFANDYEAWKL